MVSLLHHELFITMVIFKNNIDFSQIVIHKTIMLCIVNKYATTWTFRHEYFIKNTITFKKVSMLPPSTEVWFKMRKSINTPQSQLLIGKNLTITFIPSTIDPSCVKIIRYFQF
jgi:hypothetical protein